MQREIFLRHLAQTSDYPVMLSVKYAEGNYIYDTNDIAYLDFISGISVSNLGHRHPAIIKAIEDQLKLHNHVMVYGEYIQSKQLEFAKKLTSVLPGQLNSVYFVNSGSEAVEGAVKLAKRYTGRRNVIAFKNAYHGSTMGALSLAGQEWLKNSYRPLVPGIKHIRFNNDEDLNFINENIACVVAEVIQGEAGIILPDQNYLKKLKTVCKKNGTLLIFDEIQTGFGRTGKLFAFEHFNVFPDILLAGKALGGGLPLGAFISDQKIMNVLKNDPLLGHITTFGGHPLSCAAGLAALNEILKQGILNSLETKEKLMYENLKPLSIHCKIRGKGLLFALEFDSFETVKQICNHSRENGVLIDWFLFNQNAIRLAPPLSITEDEIKKACKTISEFVIGL